VSQPPVLDRRGIPRSPVTFPQHRLGQQPGNAGRRFRAQALSRAEARAWLAEMGRGRRPRFVGIRDLAHGVVLYRAGLRLQESLDLFEEHVDLEAQLVHVLEGKGGVGRAVPIDGQANEILGQWITRRRELGLNGEHPLFCTLYQPRPGLAQWDSVAREKIKRAARLAGILRRVHPHALRHTFAKELGEEGASLDTIRRLLGHKRIAYTEVYMDHFFPAHLARFMHAREWDPPVSTHRRLASSRPAGRRRGGSGASSAGA
jgi:site-specific recombinase XerD